MGDFTTAKIAFKKMLQLAWLTKQSDYEYLAYNSIATQYFYMRQLSKTDEYLKKSLYGDLEPPDSSHRVISEE